MNARAIRPTVAVIVPAFNAQATLPRCLQAIRAAMRGGDQLVVFDDGSTDDTGAIAAEAGARIIRNAGPSRGPAYGRNEAARAASAELLLFVDADVVIAPDTIERLAAEIVRSGAVAAFGSYDDRPQSARVTSLYANLRHHFVHQHGPRDASTFWSGIGMIDRAVFLGAGGYDEALYRYPSIEDVELGVRLKLAGHRIRLVREAHGQHCKDWSLWRVWHTDVIRRAYPWSELIADGRTAGVDLNVSGTERMTAAIALLIPVFLLLSVVSVWFLLGLAGALLAYVARNRAIFGFLIRRMGPWRAIPAMAMHWCYHIYASATFALVLARTRLGLRRPLSYRPVHPAGSADAAARASAA